MAFVTEDGAETDLDLGLNASPTRPCPNSVTTGSVYQSVINKERGDYNGGTVR